jgi:hypothetical protein
MAKRKCASVNVAADAGGVKVQNTVKARILALNKKTSILRRPRVRIHAHVPDSTASRQATIDEAKAVLDASTTKLVYESPAEADRGSARGCMPQMTGMSVSEYEQAAGIPYHTNHALDITCQEDPLRETSKRKPDALELMLTPTAATAGAAPGAGLPQRRAPQVQGGAGGGARPGQELRAVAQLHPWHLYQCSGQVRARVHAPRAMLLPWPWRQTGEQAVIVTLAPLAASPSASPNALALACLADASKGSSRTPPRLAKRRCCPSPQRSKRHINAVYLRNRLDYVWARAIQRRTPPSKWASTKARVMLPWNVTRRLEGVPCHLLPDSEELLKELFAGSTSMLDEIRSKAGLPEIKEGGEEQQEEDEEEEEGVEQQAWEEDGWAFPLTGEEGISFGQVRA